MKFFAYCSYTPGIPEELSVYAKVMARLRPRLLPTFKTLFVFSVPKEFQLHGMF